ncbi:MAG: AMP-binding protein [Myxococcales bacterium]|nr:AMP-binding protein [Myxococcales bacterium]
MSWPDTLPGLLMGHAERTPDGTALRERHHGIWKTLTWREYADRVADFSEGLLQLGLQPGETVAIIGDNRPEWLITELAAQAAGARSLGIYQDAVGEELAYVFDHAEVSFVVVEDQEQVDKVRELGLGERVRKVIYYDPRGLEGYDVPWLMRFTEVQTLGEQAGGRAALPERVRQTSASDLAILSTTSGTTGKPKLAMLTHDNLISMGRTLMNVDPMDPSDDFVSVLPLAWIGEQMMAVACGLTVGFPLSFPEGSDSVRRDLREIAPRVMFNPPRIWEALISEVQSRIEDTTPLKRWAYRRGLAVGTAMANARFEGRTPGVALRLAFAFANAAVLRPIKNHLGLTQLQRAYTGGAALGPDVFRFFHALGVNLKQIYGQTETSGIAVLHRDGAIDFDTVGEPLPETEVRIDEGGQILVRSPAVMRGYYRNDEATAEVMVDGWLRTGDAGYFDDRGQLIVLDRAKDVMTLADGTLFSPQFIENKLKFSPYVKEAVVFGGGAWPNVTAMMNIDFANVGKWAENQRISYTTYTDLAQKPEVYALVLAHVTGRNAELPVAARIHRFVLLHKELDADDAELTRTRKVRRNLVAERYAEIVGGLYGTDDAVQIRSTIHYQDGSSADLDTRLAIQTVP